MNVAQFGWLARVSPPIHQEIVFVNPFRLNICWFPWHQAFFETIISQNLPAGEEKATLGAEFAVD